MRGARGRRIAEGRRREAARSAVLFAMLAAEAYANRYLQIHLTGVEADAADRLPTFEKFIMGPQLVRGSKILDRGAEPAQTLKRTMATVDQERKYFLDYGRRATERLPEIDDDPAPDLVITSWSRQMDERREH